MVRTVTRSWTQARRAGRSLWRAGSQCEIRRMQLEALALFRTCTVITSLVITAISASDSVYAGIVSFGSGSNAFNMDFTTIGSPGNVADTTGSPNPAGAVSYTYQMGTYEVSEDMITKFNASQSLQITKDTRGLNKPAIRVNWNEAARFVNWLNTSTGGVAAYKFTTNGVDDNIALWSSSDAGYNPANLFRNSLATYVLPSMDELVQGGVLQSCNRHLWSLCNCEWLGPNSGCQRHGFKHSGIRFPV